MSRRNARRDFLKLTAVTGVGYWVAGSDGQAAESKSPNERVAIGCIGIGGKGKTDSGNAAEVGDVVAICDCDGSRLDTASKSFD